MSKKKKSILITGACGGLASALSKALCDDYYLVGIDPRKEKPELKFLGELHRSNYRSRKVDDIFRQHTFDAFFHLGRVPVTADIKRSDRYSENVLGTTHLLEQAKAHNIPAVIVLSTFHVYGAHPHNPLFLKENDSLRATQMIPELSDAMELDHLASQFALSFQGKTSILRPTHIVGKHITNVVSQLLRLKAMPVPLGFDPSMQLLSQEDMVRALQAVLDNPQTGVFNLAGPGSAPLSQILKMKNITKLPVPDIFIRSVLKHIPLPNFRFPSYMVDFFKFPALLDTSHFSKTYNFKYEHSLIATLENL